MFNLGQSHYWSGIHQNHYHSSFVFQSELEHNIYLHVLPGC